MNLYNVLNVSCNSTQEDIRKSYIKLIKKYHPDTGGDNNKCKEINAAYTVLSDPYKRDNYDKMNISQKNEKYDIIKNFLKYFLYKDKDFNNLIDFFLNQDFTSNFLKKRNFTKKKIKKRKILLDIDEAYNKKFFKLDSNIVIPVCNGEYIVQEYNEETQINVKILSSPELKIQDNDIIVNYYINLYEYIYGFTCRLYFPNNINIERTITSLVHRETVEIICNKGLYYLLEDNFEKPLSDLKFKRGDIYINFKLKNVDTLNTNTFLNFRDKIKFISYMNY